MIGKFLESKAGQIIISIILGFGLATIFRKVCKDNNCIMIQGPKVSEVNKYFYKIDENCYKYTPYVTPCKSV
jgi:hypothetical protein